MPDTPADARPAPNEPPHTPLALPAASDATQHASLGDPIKLDKLGPVVVNSDGTLARLPNWDKMTPDEQERTVRILSKRNQARLEKLRQPPA
ncbi:hypothetical protein MOBT1_001104 [Malassezia obtusa]|uniref:Uncharacterized protein n=1 Tax=Malassezia obtusa TaxID=76774 RepID=A0AAF0DZI1_9BASI|nr:hypothetical protein MOBT1_001104 [Malassezia obtusa]